MAQMQRELGPLGLELAPLSRADTVQMVLGCLDPAAPDFAEWLFADTHGHPFYLMETLKDLLERGALHSKPRDAGRWSFEVDADHDLGARVRVPSTIGAVVRSRLDRLSPNAISLLAAAAVLEQPLTFARLCITGSVAEETALPALDELLSSRLLVEAGPGSAADGGYTFPNEMIRDVVYTEAGDARRRLFHRRALDMLAAAHAPAAVLAHHALAAGLPEPAVRYSLAAGAEALRLSAGNEAVVHFEHARALVEAGPQTAPELAGQAREVYRQLSRAYELAGRRAQAAAALAKLASFGSE
jgi:predicted ATPase